MQGHSASNLMPVIAANRVGLEEVTPCEANGNQKSALKFYGSSFITDGAGEVLRSMDRDSEGVITAEFDLDELERERFFLGTFQRQKTGDVSRIRNHKNSVKNRDAYHEWIMYWLGIIIYRI